MGQTAGISGTVSSWRPAATGAQQGSMLGPVLFNSFISDLSKEIESSASLSLHEKSRKVNKGTKFNSYMKKYIAAAP